MSGLHKQSNSRGSRLLVLSLVAGLLFGAIFLLVRRGAGSRSTASPADDTAPSKPPPATAVSVPHRINWGDGQPVASSDGYSNIKRRDYVGAAVCGKCHKKQFKQWSAHPHRWMNAKATQESVKGDFSDVTFKYRSGKARFYRADGEYRMDLEGFSKRTYRVEQTIGSRHLQFYVGRQVAGPDLGGENYSMAHVLPLGFELGRRRWIPATNVGWNRSRFGDVVDPFAFSRTPAYHPRCIACHTTVAWGDLALKTSEKGDFPLRLKKLAEFADFSFHGSQFLSAAHSNRMTHAPASSENKPNRSEEAFLKRMQSQEAKDLSVSLGITCEACHLGGREHAANPQIPMRFAPSAPSVRYHGGQADEQRFARNAKNVNLLCARCHFNTAKTYGGGMATYNSVEVSDAFAGSCYSKLSCVNCHDPHQATGQEWSVSREKENALCTTCHKKLGTAVARSEHSHHAADSEGSRCMNCHMPKITEGINGVIRTHAIFSPTHEGMLRKNQPNACNLCHLKKSKSWTVKRLEAWYGKKLAQDADPKSDQPSGSVWLDSDHIWTRMSAAHAASQQKARWLLPKMIEHLQDDYIVGRHFLEADIEHMLNTTLDKHGYQFFQSRRQREASVKKLQAHLKEWMTDRPD